MNFHLTGFVICAAPTAGNTRPGLVDPMDLFKNSSPDLFLNLPTKTAKQPTYKLLASSAKNCINPCKS